MSDYNTGNPVPSIDPRDLDDNATNFDRLLMLSVPSVPDRLGIPRKTWWQLEQDSQALLSPNVSSLASLTLAVNKGVYATGSGTLDLFELSPFARTLLDDADQAAMQTTLGVSGKAPLASPAFSGVPTAPTPAVGVNTTQLATAAMIQAEIANKRAWTPYTPVITPTSGTFTTVSASGKSMLAFGIRYFQVSILVTTVGTGTKPIFTLPSTALAGSISQCFTARENAINGKSGVAVIKADLATAQCLDYANNDLVTANGCHIFINGQYPEA